MTTSSGIGSGDGAGSEGAGSEGGVTDETSAGASDSWATVKSGCITPKNKIQTTTKYPQKKRARDFERNIERPTRVIGLFMRRYFESISLFECIGRLEAINFCQELP